MNWLELKAMLAPLQQGAQGAVDTARFVTQQEIAPRMQSAWQAIQGLLPATQVQARNPVPYWMVPPAPTNAVQPPPQPATNATIDPFDEIAAEDAKRQAIVDKYGYFSRRVLSSKALIGE